MESSNTSLEINPASIGILELSSDDWKDYETLRHEMLRMDPEAFPPQAYNDLTKPEEYWRQRIEQGSVIIAYDGEKPIGMVRATYDIDTAKLWNMYTKQEYRGMGLGKKLMTAIMERVAGRGVGSVSLEVEDTQIPARTMYENVFGFRESGRELNERGGYMITMEKSLKSKSQD